MQAHILLTNQGRNRVVDVCGLVCLTGYAALAWYSHGTVRAPELPGFFLLLGWVSLPLLAVNCASIGCPNLSPEAFRSDNLERLLEQAAKDYINHPRGAQVEDDELVISSIYDWFKEDFGDADTGVFAHLKQYANPELADVLDNYNNFDDDYDWNLNTP